MLVLIWLTTDQRDSNSDPGSQLSLSQHLDFNELLEECFVFEALQNVLSEFDENLVPLSKAERPSSRNSVLVGSEHVSRILNPSNDRTAGL